MRFGELFCGAGGLSLGAHKAALVTGTLLEHGFAMDYDKDACDTYKHNIPGATNSTVFHADIREYDLSTLPSIDGLLFGFPCNDYSIVGERKGVNGTFGPLYKYGVEVINMQSPKWFVAENVSGLASSDNGHTLQTIIDELSKAGHYGGYDIVAHQYHFEDYGVPQKRHRIIIVGTRSDLELSFDVPSTEPYRDIDISVGHALTVPPLSGLPNNELTKQSAVVIERLKRIKPGENAFTADLPERLKLNVKGAKISQIYKRLVESEPAYTVTGSGGGGTHVYHWSENRALTNRERARLQTFPDSFVFYGSKESVRKQIGMAVPVKGAQVIFESLFKTLLDKNIT